MKCLICQKTIKPFFVFEKKALFNKPTARENFGGTAPMGLGYCASCRHISSNAPFLPQWSETEKTIYGELYSSFTPGVMSEAQRRYTKFLFGWLVNTLPKGKILEIGSHDGYFLNMFKKAGWDCRGVEPSPAAKIAEKKYGIPTFHDFFRPELFGKEKFDFIIIKHVIEHVANPLEFTRQAVSLLKDRGLLYIEVPNSYVSLHETYFPEFHIDHISYFTIPSLEKLLKLTESFETIRLESTWAHMKFPFIHVLLKKIGKNKKKKAVFGESRYLIDNSISSCIAKFGDYYRVYLANLRKLSRSAKKIALWGSGSCGTQFAIDGKFKKSRTIVVDPNKVNQGKYLTVTGHVVHNPSILRKIKVDRVLVASGWEDDVIKQIPRYAGKKLNTVRFSDLLRKS